MLAIIHTENSREGVVFASLCVFFRVGPVLVGPGAEQEAGSSVGTAQGELGHSSTSVREGKNNAVITPKMCQRAVSIALAPLILSLSRTCLVMDKLSSLVRYLGW